MKVRMHYCPNCRADEYFFKEIDRVVKKEGIAFAKKINLCERCNAQFTWNETRREIIEI